MLARAPNATSPLLPRELSLIGVPAGLCDPAREDTYRLSLNVGAPVWGTCLDPGGARRYLREPGSINFVPAGSTIVWQLESHTKLLKLGLTRALIKTAAKDLGVDSKSLDFRSAIRVRDVQIEWLVRALHMEQRAGNPNGLIFSETLSLALSMTLIRQFARATPLCAGARGRLTPAETKRISDYIHENLSRQDLSLGELASVAGFSLSHFKALFRRTTGIPVHRFVVQCRVEQAALLLHRGHMSIADVAAETGFAHASHLARWTQRVLGAAPAALRGR
jgi:AraC family transcriptional regulator